MAPRGERSTDEYLGRRVEFEGDEPVNIYERLVGERQARAAARDERSTKSRRGRDKRQRRGE